MPDPTEKTILSQTLLPPSALPTVISLKTFTSLFPQSLREHPQIPLLYRNLQHQRNLDLDHVRENITSEARRGEQQQREVAKTRWRDAKGGRKITTSGPNADIEEREGDMEGMLYGSNAQNSQRPHTLATIVPALESACEELDAETKELDSESEKLLKQMQTIVGDLSDLRYGKLPRASLRNEALEGLRALEAECDKALG